jgi:protein-S-isoprenylcysteine O-methyltransferase Ste14
MIEILVPVLVFLIGSAVLFFISRPSLRQPHSHGYYRFLAWEPILALVAVNLWNWFAQPASWHQVISWLLLSISLFLVVHGVHLLRSMGRPDSQRQDAELLAFEKTTRLVTRGAYRYIRHPLYSSLLFLAWGAAFKEITILNLFLAADATYFLVATARAEELENVRFFGPAYSEYMQQTKMFIPYLF